MKRRRLTSTASPAAESSRANGSPDKDPFAVDPRVAAVERTRLEGLQLEAQIGAVVISALAQVESLRARPRVAMEAYRVALAAQQPVEGAP